MKMRQYDDTINTMVKSRCLDGENAISLTIVLSRLHNRTGWWYRVFIIVYVSLRIAGDHVRTSEHHTKPNITRFGRIDIVTKIETRL